MIAQPPASPCESSSIPNAASSTGNYVAASVSNAGGATTTRIRESTSAVTAITVSVRTAANKSICKPATVATAAPSPTPAPVAPKATILSATYDLVTRARQFLKLYPGLRGQYNLELVHCTPYLTADEKELLQTDYSAVFQSLNWTEVAYTSRLDKLVPASRTPFKDCITFCWYAYVPYSLPGTRMRTLYQNVLFRDSATWYMTNKQAMLRRLLLFDAAVRAAVASGLATEGPSGACGVTCASFIPHTLIYSQGRESAVAAAMGQAAAATYIVKPATGLQGRGIQFYRGPPVAAEFASFMLHHYGEDAVRSNFYVVQRYVDRPLLIRGRKFDLRVYLLVVPNMSCCLGCDSNSVRRGFYAFYHPGFARLSCLEYGDGGSSDRRVHLTNCCVQDGADGGGNCLDDVNWTPDQVNEYFNQRFDQGLDGMPRRDWFRTTLQADLQGIAAHVLVQFSRMLSAGEAAGNSFKLLGCDFLVDAGLRPWLLELNSLPSLRVRSQCQRAVKTPMQREALALAVEVAHRSANGLPVTARCLAMRQNFRLIYSATNARLQGGLVRAFQQRLGTPGLSGASV